VAIACIQLPFYEITERLPIVFLAFAIVYREITTSESRAAAA
jgi:hypothetical protein